MNLLSVKLKIGDREYPMKVKPEEEERVRNAGKAINERLKTYREKFGIDDKEDLLAMVAFDATVARMKGEEEMVALDHHSEAKIETLDQLIQKTLS